MFRARLAVVVCLAGLAVPMAAAAQEATTAPQPPPAATSSPEPSASDQEARSLFRAGTSALDDGRFEDALAHFERAYELTHRSELLYNIGLTAVTLQRTDRALSAFEQFLRDSPETSHRREVEGRIRSLRAMRPRRTTAPSGGATRADAGPGAGPWIVLGSSGAVAIGGVVLFSLGLLSNSNVRDAAPGTPWATVSADYDRGPLFTTLGAIVGAIGLAGTAAGIGWLVTGRDGDERVRVTVGPGGIAVGGRL